MWYAIALIALWLGMVFAFYYFVNEKITKFFNVYIVILVALMISTGIVGAIAPKGTFVTEHETVHGTHRTYSEPKLSDVKQLSGTGEVWQVTFYLKQHLRDPDSYQSISWGKLEVNGDGNYGIIHKYRAKNGYGGYNVESQYFELDKGGHVVRVTDLSR